MTFFLQKLFISSWKKKQIADGFLEELKKMKNAIKSLIENEKKIQKPSNCNADKGQILFSNVFVNISL